MNPYQFRNQKASFIQSYQQLQLNKVSFPSQNLVIQKLNCIKEQKLLHNKLRLNPTKPKLYKFENNCEPSSFTTKVIKVCNLEFLQDSNELKQKIQQSNYKRLTYRSIDQNNLMRIKSNQIKVRQLSNDFITNRNIRSNSQPPTKKQVRFYEKVEYWVQTKEQNIEYDYRYFEALNQL